MNNVCIEEWNETYRQDFISLSLEWLEKYLSVEPIDLEILNDPEGYILSKGGRIFFARQGDDIVGTVSMIPQSEGIFELAKLAVTEKYQGLRIGHMLMTRCIQFAHEQQAQKIVLFTAETLKAAVKLYQSHGFSAVPLEDKRYVEADLFMVLTLLNKPGESR